MTNLLPSNLVSVATTIITDLKTAQTAPTASEASTATNNAIQELKTLKSLILPSNTIVIGYINNIEQSLVTALSNITTTPLATYQLHISQLLALIASLKPPVAIKNITLSLGIPIFISSDGQFMKLCIDCALPTASNNPTNSQFACQGYNVSFETAGSGEFLITMVWYLQPAPLSGYYLLYNLANQRYLRTCANCVGMNPIVGTTTGIASPISFQTCCDYLFEQLDKTAYWALVKSSTGGYKIQNASNNLYLSTCVGCIQQASIRGTANISNQPIVQPRAVNLNNTTQLATNFAIQPLVPSDSGLQLYSGAICVLINDSARGILSYCHNCALKQSPANSFACNGQNVFYRPAPTGTGSLWYILPPAVTKLISTSSSISCPSTPLAKSSVTSSLPNVYNLYNLYTGKLLKVCTGCIGTTSTTNPITGQLCNNGTIAEATSLANQWTIDPILSTNGQATGDFSIVNMSNGQYLGVCSSCLTEIPNLPTNQPITNSSATSGTNFHIVIITPTS